jgi:hypothetical protein
MMRMLLQPLNKRLHKASKNSQRHRVGLAKAWVIWRFMASPCESHLMQIKIESIHS